MNKKLETFEGRSHRLLARYVNKSSNVSLELLKQVEKHDTKRYFVHKWTNGNKKFRKIIGLFYDIFVME